MNIIEKNYKKIVRVILKFTIQNLLTYWSVFILILNGVFYFTVEQPRLFRTTATATTVQNYSNSHDCSELHQQPRLFRTTAVKLKTNHGDHRVNQHQ